MGVSVSAVALILLSPLFIVISLLLLFTGEHYVFYFQQQIGLKNQPFDIWKFATMLKNSPNMGTGTITLRKDPRVLPCGTFFRKTKINELLQIGNVFIGDMSVVGPRPLTANHFNIYSQDVKEILYHIKQGIMRIGSIVFRDEERLISASDLPFRWLKGLPERPEYLK